MEVQKGTAQQLILLVDDCRDTRDMYVELLEEDFRIVVASTGAEAVRCASELRPSLVVMDLALPDMSGEEAILRIRQDQGTDRVPIVVVSGYPEPRQSARVWDAYLLKPCHADVLSSCIRKVLDRSVAEATGPPHSARLVSSQ